MIAQAALALRFLSRAFAENLKLYAKQACIERIHIHQTRHTYAALLPKRQVATGDAKGFRS